MSQLTHINAAGEAHMVDVSAKAETVREARAEVPIETRGRGRGESLCHHAQRDAGDDY